MYEYAIEDFLLDVYYPIENDVAMEGTDSGSGLFGKLMAIISRFIEFIRTNIIDRIKRFIRAMRSKIASESNDKFMVTQNMLNVTNTAMRYVDNGESAISSVDQWYRNYIRLPTPTKSEIEHLVLIRKVIIQKVQKLLRS